MARSTKQIAKQNDEAVLRFLTVNDRRPYEACDIARGIARLSTRSAASALARLEERGLVVRVTKAYGPFVTSTQYRVAR